METLTSLLREDSAVTAIEYALLGALIAVAIVGAVTGVGTALLALFDDVSNKVAAAVG